MDCPQNVNRCEHMSGESTVIHTVSWKLSRSPPPRRTGNAVDQGHSMFSTTISVSFSRNDHLNDLQRIGFGSLFHMVHKNEKSPGLMTQYRLHGGMDAVYFLDVHLCLQDKTSLSFYLAV